MANNQKNDRKIPRKLIITEYQVSCLQGRQKFLEFILRDLFLFTDILSSVYYSNIGCFDDTRARTIPNRERQDPVLDGNYKTRRNPVRKCALAAKKRGHNIFVVMADGQCASGPNTDRNFIKFGYSKSECSAMAVNNVAYIVGYERAEGANISILILLSILLPKDIHVQRTVCKTTVERTSPVGGYLLTRCWTVFERQSVLSCGRRGGLVVDSRQVRVRALAESLCCVLGQDTLLSQCLSPPRSINGYQQTVRET